ncbi:MAG: enolase C-terminal domain-like protein [Actinomycetota bacterium]|nr:enolase C-terminal domain-like protein [Actinomycetota bacterium]
MQGRIWELSIPLRTPFATAAGRVDVRRLVLVSVTDGTLVGFGEAAPYPGITSDTVDDAWRTLERGIVLSPTAAAALDEATADLAARRDGKPLWETVGGSARSIPTSIAIGLEEDPVERIEATGAGGAKLKIRPGSDVARVADVRAAFPDMPIGVDANGSYDWEDRSSLLALDGLGVEYVEQPFPADDLTSHARLRDEIVAAVALDEPIDSEAAAIRAIEAGACDMLVVKPARLGVAAARAIHDLALVAGLRIKASGLLETEVGRAFTFAIAMLPAAVHSDIADASWYLAGSLTATEPGVESGEMHAGNGAGIGFDPDPAAFAPYVVRESVLGSRIWD